MRGDRKGTEDCESLFKKKQNITTVWTELKDDWSAETVPAGVAVTTRRRIDFAPLPLADTDMQMSLLCDTTHRLRTDANKQPLKTNHNPKEWRVIFFFPPRAQKIWNIPLWLMHHLQPVLRLSSLQCEITTPPMSSPPPPLPNTLSRYFQESCGFNLTLSGVISARQTHQRPQGRICVLLGAHYSNGQTRLSWFGFYISLASAADMSLWSLGGG